MVRKLQIDDLAGFVAVSDPQISPSLDKVAFVTVRADKERDDYESIIWVVNKSDGRPVRFLSGGKDRHPRWSPEGRQLLFVSDRGLKEGEKGAGLWVSPVYGGEPRLIVRIEKGIGDPRWSADGGKVFFVSGVGEEDEEVRVIDSIPIWFDAMGFTYHRRMQLHSVDVASGVVTQLTEGETSVVTAAPSNKGDKIAYAVVADELNPGIVDLFVLDLETGESSEVASGFVIASICWSPDDEYVAFLGNDRSRGYPTHMCVWTV
ncbi:MAG: PD40 domain-containing protein, partial [Candidatus Bathyarchaeota archaeon]